jgi:hypothetical protein
MTAATITEGNLILVDFRAAQTVTAPRKRRALWHWPWWWPAALRDRLARMERNWDAISAALAGCTS